MISYVCSCVILIYLYRQNFIAVFNVVHSMLMNYAILPLWLSPLTSSPKKAGKIDLPIA